jgi:hypothetical protein
VPNNLTVIFIEEGYWANHEKRTVSFLEPATATPHLSAGNLIEMTG